MTNEELADLIVARTNNLRDHLEGTMDARFAALDAKLDAAGEFSDRALSALASHMGQRLDRLEERFDAKMTALQTHIYGKLLSIESDMLDLRGDILKLREAVGAQARALDEHRGTA